MKHLSSSKVVKTLAVLIGTLVLMGNAYAHEASMHKKKNAEKPKCEAMNNSDHSKMDKNDPIMQAMMQQCMGDKSHDQAHAESETSPSSSPKKHDSGHQN